MYIYYVFPLHVPLQVRTSSRNPSLMSREKISVVGADYRTHYPRLRTLTGEGSSFRDPIIATQRGRKRRPFTDTGDTFAAR
jgi:hypothetical protein